MSESKKEDRGMDKKTETCSNCAQMTSSGCSTAVLIAGVGGVLGSPPVCPDFRERRLKEKKSE